MKSPLTIVLVLLAIPVMAQDEAVESAMEGETLPEILGVCGAIHKTVLDLGPRNLDGQLDTKFIWVQEGDAGFNRVIFPAPQVVKNAFPDHPPIALEIQEFKGNVQAAVAMWKGTENEKSVISDGLLDQLVRMEGAPAVREDELNEWRNDRFRTAVSWPRRDDDLVMFVSCLQKEDEFFEARDTGEMSKDDSTSDVGGAQNIKALSPWDKESIVSILKSYGQPSEKPHEIGDHVVGLHYGGLNMDGMPYEVWYWFFEGRAIYSASEFLPAGGSISYAESFDVLKKVAFDRFGKPDKHILGEDGIGQRFIWREGSQGLAITFVEGDGDPWFILETYDKTHLDKIDTDLRPGRTLPNRYEPPPPDSGKDRLDLTPQVAEG